LIPFAFHILQNIIYSRTIRLYKNVQGAKNKTLSDMTLITTGDAISLKMRLTLNVHVGMFTY